MPVAVNCAVAPGSAKGCSGVTRIEASVFVEPPEPPEPPPQPARSTRIRKRRGTLFDFIDAHSLRDQGLHIRASLQVPHMPPFLDDDTVRFYLRVPAARSALGLPQRGVVL